LNKEQPLEERLMQEIINLALAEDRARDDVTTNSLKDYDNQVTAAVIAKENGIISGTGVFIATFITVDPVISINVFKGDGSEVKKGDIVLEIKGMECHSCLAPFLYSFSF
jgi:nicotinate-nucleotide pyrophosphorylase (carboxylating)